MGKHELQVAKRAMLRTRGLDDDVERFLEPAAQYLCPGMRFLELGCGKGLSVSRLAERHGATAYGVDLTNYSHLSDHAKPYTEIFITDEPLRLLGAGIDSALRDVRFSAADATRLPFPDASFDFVFSFWVLPYVPDKLRVVREAHRVLRDGGLALIDLGPENWKVTYTGVTSIVATTDRPNELATDSFELHSVGHHRRLTVRKLSAEPLGFPPPYASWHLDRNRLLVGTAYTQEDMPTLPRPATDRSSLRDMRLLD